MTQPNKSLREKSAARLVAAQMLYTIALNGSSLNPERMMKDYSDYISESKTRPNMAHVKKLLEGLHQHGEALEPWLDKMLKAEWKKDRMSPLLLAILRLGIFELAHAKQTASPIIVNEYVTLAGQFFSEQETGFVNAALNGIAAELRA